VKGVGEEKVLSSGKVGQKTLFLHITAETTSYSWQTRLWKIEFRATNRKMCSNGVTQCVMTDKYFPRDILNIIAGELTPEERESFRAVHPNLTTIRPMYGPLDFAMSAARGNMAMLELSLTRDARFYYWRHLNAVKANNFDFVFELITLGLPAEMVAEDAAICGNLEMLKFALHMGANVEGNEDICVVAAGYGHADVVELLVKRGSLPPLCYLDVLALKGELTILRCIMAARPAWSEVVWEHREDYSPAVLNWIEDCERGLESD
jgi:hypothetical protein